MNSEAHALTGEQKLHLRMALILREGHAPAWVILDRPDAPLHSPALNDLERRAQAGSPAAKFCPLN
jgi:hypothetical protein